MSRIVQFDVDKCNCSSNHLSSKVSRPKSTTSTVAYFVHSEWLIAYAGTNVIFSRMATFNQRKNTM